MNRIAFVCSSVERGKDGVGDYTRLLAEELASRGHQVSIISVAERHLPEPVQEALHADVLYLRCNARQDRRHWGAVAEFIAEHDPNWLSLQFVPWSYGPRGIPLGVGRRLVILGNQRRWHVMCHELWVEPGDDLKDQALSRAQKFATKRLLRRLRPKLVHASINLNVTRLRDAGIPAKKLPIFGNIPIASEALQREQTIVFFGALPLSQATRTRYSAELREAALVDSRLSVAVVGGDPNRRRHFVRQLEVAGLRAQDMGHLDEAAVSALLARSRVGVARNAGRHLGKSGSLHAMLEHGMAIWAPELGDDEPDVEFHPERIFSDLSDALSAETWPTHGAIGRVAARFLDDLASVV